MQLDDTGDWAAMREALIAAGFPPADLRQAVWRGTGPAPVRPGHQGLATLWRWGDVLEWAQNRRLPSKIDLGDAALGRWLAPRETAFAFARRLGLYDYWVHRLIGHRTSQWRDRLPPDDAVRLIALATEIPIETLIADATRFARERVNGKGTQEPRVRERPEARGKPGGDTPGQHRGPRRHHPPRG